MFKHVANEMTLSPRLSDTMVFLCSVIVILKKEFIKVAKFNLQSLTRDHRNHDKMDVIAANLQVMRCQQAKTLLISSDEMLKARLEEVKKKFNTRHDKFLGTKFTESIRSYFNEHLVFAYAYLYSKDYSTGTGIIHIHIIYDTITTEDGFSKSVSAGYFEQTVNLNYFNGVLRNPMCFDEGGNYFEEYWLRESAIWSR